MRLPASFVLSISMIIACSPTTVGGRRDASTGDAMMVDAGDARTPSDAFVPTDVDRPDIVIPEDATCEQMTPIMTSIIGDPPDMLLTVDISGSMCTPLLGGGGFGDTKLKVMKEALKNLVSEKEARIRFGMMLFPASSGACDAGTVRNAIADNNAAGISSTLNGLQDDFFSCPLQNGGATPTSVSVDAAKDHILSLPVNDIGRYILLATDGEPNCGPPDAEGNTTSTVPETITAIQAASSVGIKTYVLGFGGSFGSNDRVLTDMAAAGGTMRPFSANSGAELSAALDMIAAEIIPPSCTVQLEGAAQNPDLFQVSFDGGALIPRNPARTSGWDYDAGSNTITLYGAECDTLQGGTVTKVDVDFGCPGPLI